VQGVTLLFSTSEIVQLQFCANVVGAVKRRHIRASNTFSLLFVFMSALFLTL